MKILLYTDNHFCKQSSIIRGQGQKYSIRLENQIKSLNWVERLAEEREVELIVHLGDFFDKPSLNAEELTALKDVQWSDIPHNFIVGNHEINTSDLRYSSLNALYQVGKIISCIQLNALEDVYLLYLPYIAEDLREPLSTYLENVPKDKPLVILSHNDISGIRYGQFESKIGFNIEEITNSCDLFINGHLHNQQQVNEKVLNLGNLTGQNFGEDATKYSHCVGILDTKTLKIELINNPYAFNFYKLDIESIEDYKNKGDSLKDNCCLTIKAPQSIIPKLKEELIKNKEIINFRILGTFEKKDSTLLVEHHIEKVDHIQQFKEFIINQVQANELLIEELQELC